MLTSILLQSKKNGEISNFLSKFYNTDLKIKNDLKWEKTFQNPIEMADFIGIYADNINSFNIKMWIKLDKDVFINISEQNANLIIKYLFERYPY